LFSLVLNLVDLKFLKKHYTAVALMRSKVASLAPIVVESPQLPLSKWSACKRGLGTKSGNQKL